MALKSPRDAASRPIASGLASRDGRAHRNSVGDWTPCTIGGSSVIRAARTMMSWILLAATLVSLPGEAAGRFVCSLGMAQAGPACPLCHGHASRQQPGAAIGKSCCKFVGGHHAPDSRLANAQVEQPVLGLATPLLADAG